MAMEFRDIQIGKRYWVLLGEDEMYGADNSIDNLVEVFVDDKNYAHLDIDAKCTESADEWILDPEQFYETKEEAQAVMGSDQIGGRL